MCYYKEDADIGRNGLMNIFLTGATGFLGGRLIQNLAREGHTLYVLARNIKKAEKLIQKTVELKVTSTSYKEILHYLV